MSCFPQSDRKGSCWKSQARDSHLLLPSSLSTNFMPRIAQAHSEATAASDDQNDNWNLVKTT